MGSERVSDERLQELLADIEQEHVVATTSDWNDYRRAARRDHVAALRELVELRAEVEGLRRAIEPYLGDPECAHDRVHNVHGGRRDLKIIGYTSCGECGAHLDVVAALAPSEEA